MRIQDGILPADTLKTGDHVIFIYNNTSYHAQLSWHGIGRYYVKFLDERVRNDSVLNIIYGNTYMDQVNTIYISSHVGIHRHGNWPYADTVEDILKLFDDMRSRGCDITIINTI